MIRYLEKNRSFSVLFMVLIVIEIFTISSIPGSSLATKGIDPSLVYHLLVFFLLNFFIILSMTGKKGIGVKYLILSLVLSILYAILDEIHQFFVPLRFPSVTDVLVDTMGIFLSTIVYTYYKRNH